MIIRQVNLETVCGVTSRFPKNTLPEFAFAGKSNVGKSSLINALLNRKNLARVGASPGKTQTVNFYNVNEAFYLVDLPGYGYAKVPPEAKAAWGRMIERYLQTSEMLRQVFLLVDIRHEPGANDRQMHDWIVAAGLRPLVIATKADKISRGQLPRQLKLIRTALETEGEIIPFSAETKQGREEIHTILEAYL
ncbi:MAG: YihA family ribosome biogenesis GTP-binding protein [Lachnospiraceae bacterium]|nr:YihA family ribosome biogenesis GTP-binding protein [Lachnospiraceae bacterium]